MTSRWMPAQTETDHSTSRPAIEEEDAIWCGMFMMVFWDVYDAYIQHQANFPWV